MSWRRVLKSVQALSAHTLLFCFTLLLVFKLDHVVSCSWWIIFFPLWMFHAVVARGRFSLPAPLVPRNRHWAPCHAVVAIPLLIAFELLLCIYLEGVYVHGFAAVNLKIVFLPLLTFEIIILIDNFRMCRALMPGDEDNMSHEAIWETLPHFWVAISMVFFVAATVFTLLKLCGDVGAIGWWDLFINFGIAECFSFLVCTKWSNPVIHRNSRSREASSSSSTIRYLDRNSGLVVSSEDNQHQERMCGLQDIGGHFMKVPVIGFQILLCMRLEVLVYCFLHLNWWRKLYFCYVVELVEEYILDFLQELMIAWGFCTMVQGYWVGGPLMKGVEKNRHGCSKRGHMGIILSVVILLILSRKCLKRILPRRSGDSRRLLGSKQKLQNTVNRSLKDSRMRKCCAESVLRGRLALYCYLAGTESSAGLNLANFLFKTVEERALKNVWKSFNRMIMCMIMATTTMQPQWFV